MPLKDDIFETLELKLDFAPCYKEKKMNKNEKLKNVDTIIIIRDGNTVYAYAYDKCPDGDIRSTACHKAIAKCGLDDVFDFNIGAKIAFDRLYEGYDMTPKPKRKPYNGRIAICWNETNFDIFNVKDGKLDSFIWVLRAPCQQKDTIYEDSSFEEMKQAVLNCASAPIHPFPPVGITRIGNRM